jgi:hypothetical protein
MRSAASRKRKMTGHFTTKLAETTKLKELKWNNSRILRGLRALLGWYFSP